MLALLLDEKEQDVELRIEFISLAEVFLDQLLLVDLEQIVILVDFGLPDVLTLRLLVFCFGYSILHCDLFVKLFEKVLDDVDHLSFLLLI